MVVDTSVLLAVLFGEPAADWAAARLEEHAGALLMSTVNLAETLILLRDRQPRLADDLEREVLESGIHFVAPGPEQARIAARARLDHPLNLGDCFAYALAARRNCPILTLDADFQALGHPIVRPPGS